MINIEQMWKEYCHFESTQIGPTYKEKLEDLNKEFQNIKRVSREYENVTRPLERHMPAVPLEFSVHRLDDEEEFKQVYGWKRYILWEKQNPLKLDDHQALIKRVLFAYEQSFLCLAYHCDIWHEAACYIYKQSDKYFAESFQTQDDLYLKESNQNAAACLYERAINTFMKNNILINLAYADFEEVSYFNQRFTF